MCAHIISKKKKKKIVEWICGNGIAEIGGGEDFAIGLWQCHCRNMEKNLWQLWQCHCRKWEEKKIVVAEIWRGMKKKSVTTTIFL